MLAIACVDVLATPLQTGKGWAPRSLLFEFRVNDGVPWLQLTLGPGDTVNNDLRERLFETVGQHPTLFRLKSTSLTDDWVILHEEEDYILDAVDKGIGWDDGTTRAKAEAWVERFAANGFPAMNELIVNCLRQYGASQQT